MKSTTEYIRTLESVYKENSDPVIAVQQKAYLKNQFEFFGIKTPDRRILVKPFFDKKHLPEKNDTENIVKALFQKPQREYHYFAQELIALYKKKFEKKDIQLLEFLIENNSWWDTVDFIAVHLAGYYFKLYPEQIDPCIKKWLRSDNIWLQRTCLLFQLKYKKQTDTVLLAKVIDQLNGTKEFFINKAIGWVLREFSRTNEKWVIDFVNTRTLSNLSKKEALRLIQ